MVEIWRELESESWRRGEGEGGKLSEGGEEESVPSEGSMWWSKEGMAGGESRGGARGWR